MFQPLERGRVAIVGGGIVGLATAYRLLQRFPGARITVFEKEAAVGQHQSGHNSGVLHCGLYYKPGSRRARLAVCGIQQMIEFCQSHSIPHEVCGKVVVAASDEERPRLEALFERGRQNGLRGLRLLNSEELREIEPHAAGVAAIHAPQEGIADYPRVCEALVDEIHARGGEVRCKAKVTAIHRSAEGWRIEHSSGDFGCDFLITCAGLHSDRMAAMTGHASSIRIVPFRGEYFLIRPERQFLVRNLIYPVPDPRFPFLGVHFTRMIRGGVECGPNAVLALAREGYRKADVSLRDVAEAFRFAGLWRFLRKYPGACWAEIRRSFSKELFCRTLQRLVPEIRMEDLLPGGAGVRAQAMSADGSLVDDFHFVEDDRAIHVVNAPSPGATASLAIGEEIAAMAARS
ncbi:MAG TPA: L-2-hydroxyglutarate oxidase [Bryobacteraceae bacterium]|nr:L-2-hydroxyglutarate oxidase [Bryobacteraceae bacterium]